MPTLRLILPAALAALLLGCAAPDIARMADAPAETPTATPGPPMPRIISAGQPCLFEVAEWGAYSLPLAEYCPHLLGRTDLVAACEKDNRLTDENLRDVQVTEDGRSIQFWVEQHGTCSILPDPAEGEEFAGTAIGSLGRPVILIGLAAMALLGGGLVIADRVRGSAQRPRP
jgi:hypothetical protein